MKNLLAIALGSALGGVARYGLDLMVGSVGTMPLATLLANMSGSFLLGCLAGRWAMGGAVRPHSYKWHFWMTGVCGGYTTFSALSWQVLELIQQGEGQVAGLYAAVSMGLGIFAVWLGVSLGTRKVDR